MIRTAWAAAFAVCLFATGASAQDTTGTIEGAVTDNTSSPVASAHVVARNVDTGFTRETDAGADGFYRLLLLPIGQYSVTVKAPQFATLVREPIQVNVSQAVRLNLQLQLPSVSEMVTVTGDAQLVDTSTNALGRVVTGRELVDLPLNGRNFTQLGLLQTGVAPLTAGVATAGGSLRQGQAYAVNGMRPEQNMYLVDGAQNINRMDGGYALKLPGRGDCRVPDSHAERATGIRRHRRRHHERGDPFGREPVPRRPVRVPAQRCLRRAELLFREGRAAAAAPVRRHDRRPDHQGSAAVLRVLRRLPQHARGDHDRHGAHPAGASGRLLRNGDAAHQLRGRGDADPRKHHSRCGDQPGLAQCNGALSARERLTVHLSGHARRQQRARFGRRPRRFHRVAERSDLRPLLVLRRPQHQSDLGPGHRRAGVPDARRHLDPRRHDVEHAHLLAVAHELAARHVAAPCLLLRSAPEPDAAERARVRLRLVERSRPGAAVLQHQRLHADWRRDHRVLATRRRTPSRSRTTSRGPTARTW